MEYPWLTERCDTQSETLEALERSGRESSMGCGKPRASLNLSVGPALLGVSIPVLQRKAPWVDFFRLFIFLGIIKQFTSNFTNVRISTRKLISPCMVTGGHWQPLIFLRSSFPLSSSMAAQSPLGGRRRAGQWLTEVPLDGWPQELMPAFHLRKWANPVDRISEGNYILQDCGKSLPGCRPRK